MSHLAPRFSRPKILIALAVLIAGLMALQWHYGSKEVAPSGGGALAKGAPETRIHPLPPDPTAAAPKMSEGAGGAEKLDSSKANLSRVASRTNVPDAVSKAIAITAWKDEVKERASAFGYRGQGYRFTADRDRITTALPWTSRTGKRPVLSMTLDEILVGDHVIVRGGPTAPELRAAARTIFYARGPVEERYVLRRSALEQDFVIRELPSGRGEITIRSTVQSNLAPPAEGTRGTELVFKDEGREAISLSKAVAIDAAGRKLPLELAYTHGQVCMTVPAGWVQGATLPIIVDPLIGGAITIDPTIDFPTEIHDVSYCPVTNEWLVVWTDSFGATSDTFGQRVSAAGTLVGAAFIISGNTNDFQPAISYSATNNRYLVAWQASGSPSNTITGRFVDPDGSMPSAPFVIASPAGSNDQTSVAADRSGGWYVVFRNHNAGASTGRGCLVSSTGTVTPGIDFQPSAPAGLAWPRVAYANNQYMVMWQAGLEAAVRGVSTAGAMLTPVTTAPGSNNGNAGDISGAGDRFLLSWTDSSQLKVRGRIAAANGGASIQFLTAEFDVYGAFAYYPSAAFSETSGAWYVIHETQSGPDSDLKGNTVSSAGVASASTDMIATPTSLYRPRLAWNSATNEVLVTYQFTGTSPAQILAQRISMPGTAAAVLQGRWKFDEGAGTLTADSSGNGNDGTLIGGVSWTAGKSGSAVSLDGVDDYVSVIANGMPAANAAQSISWWMNYAAVPGGNQCVIGLTNDAASSAVQCGFRGGQVSVWNFGGTVLVQALAPSVGTWHHVAYTFNGVTHRLYIDGIEVNTSIVAAQTAVPDNLEFGRWSGGSEYFAGLLDEVQVYGGTLTPAQVAGLAIDPALEAYFKFDEGTGTTTADNSGNGHTGTLLNGSTWGPGQPGTALSLDGVDDNVSCVLGSGLPANNAPQTLSWWMNYASVPGGTQAVVCLTNPAAGSAVQGGFRNGAVTVWNWGGNTLVSAAAPSPNTWHNFIYTFDGTTHTLYIDGVAANSSTAAAQTAAPARLDLGFTPGWAENFAGRVDEVRIYSRCLSVGEAASLANFQKLEAYFKFDEGTGTFTADSSGKGHHGTLNNGTGWGVGSAGSAVVLDGTDDDISCILGTGLPANNAPQTISWWMNYPSVPGGVQAAVCLTNPGAGSAVQAGFRNGVITVWNWGGNTLVSAAAPSTNTWHQVAYSFDGTTHRLYVDGALANSSTVAPQTAAPSRLDFGFTPGWAENLAGSLDEVRIYSRKLSDAEIAGLAFDPSLAAYFKFDENAGTVAADSTGHGHDGTLGGGATWTVGMLGSAISLNGSTAFVSCTAGTDLPANNAPQTVAWWMNVSQNPSGTATAFDLHNDGAASAVQGGFRNGNVTIWNHGGNVLAEATPPSASAWHHYAYTFDGTTHLLYIDGQQAGSSTAAPQTAQVASLVFGRWNGGPGEYFGGALDDLRIYTRPLSAAEVLGLSQVVPPGAPTGLVAAPGNAQVNLTWNAVGTSTYKVFRRIAVNAYNFNSPLASGLTSPSYLDQTAANGTHYFYVVRAVNALGESGNSNEADATPAAPPAPPTGLQASGGDNQVSLTWTASSGAAAYKVFRRTGSTSYDYGAPLAPPGGATTFLDQTALNGTTYFYVVRATNVGGESADSNEAQATPAPPGTPPAAPTNLQSAGGDNQVTLTWVGSQGATNYKVFRRLTSGSYNFASPLTLVQNGTAFNDSSAQNNTTYFYVVRATNTAGDSGSSNEASATPTAGGGPSAPVITTSDKKTNDATPVITGTSVAGATITVYFNGVADGQVVASGTTWSYHNTGSLKPDDLYIVTATATNGSGTSAPSSPALVTVDTTAPDVPTNLVATPKNGAIALSWNASGAPDTRGYNIYRKPAGPGAFQKVNPKVVLGTRYLDTTTQAGQAYTYRVTAVDDTLHEAHQ
jgi:fibronectin type 3 domain-containing protein